MIVNIKDLSPNQKAAIESLLGRPVKIDEFISVRAIEAPNRADHVPHERILGAGRGDQVKVLNEDWHKPMSDEEANAFWDGRGDNSV